MYVYYQYKFTVAKVINSTDICVQTAPVNCIVNKTNGQKEDTNKNDILLIDAMYNFLSAALLTGARHDLMFPV